MYINAKMIPAESVPGIRGGGIKESSRRVELIYLIHFNNFCKWYNVGIYSL
jgi:hypothetical protein